MLNQSFNQTNRDIFMLLLLTPVTTALKVNAVIDGAIMLHPVCKGWRASRIFFCRNHQAGHFNFWCWAAEWLEPVHIAPVFHHIAVIMYRRRKTASAKSRYINFHILITQPGFAVPVFLITLELIQKIKAPATK